MEIKEYTIKCSCCKKELTLDVELMRIGYKNFIKSLKVSKTSQCKCIKAGLDIHSFNMLGKDLKYIEENQDIIVKHLEEKQD